MDIRTFRVLNGEVQMIEPPKGGAPFSVLIKRDGEEAVVGAITLDPENPFAAVSAIEADQGAIFSTSVEFYSVMCAPAKQIIFAVLDGVGADIKLIFS
jgi:hypothetical protein